MTNRLSPPSRPRREADLSINISATRGREKTELSTNLLTREEINSLDRDGAKVFGQKGRLGGGGGSGEGGKWEERNLVCAVNLMGMEREWQENKTREGVGS